MFVCLWEQTLVCIWGDLEYLCLSLKDNFILIWYYHSSLFRNVFLHWKLFMMKLSKKFHTKNEKIKLWTWKKKTTSNLALLAVSYINFNYLEIYLLFYTARFILMFTSVYLFIYLCIYLFIYLYLFTLFTVDHKF